MCGAVADMEACIPALRRHAAALLRDGRDVDELVRTCLSRALERRQAADAHTDMRTWLLSIMHGELASTAWRARLRRVRKRGEAAGPAMPAVLRSLDGLTDGQRAVLLLVSVEALTYQEVTLVLGISLRDVMSLLAAGRERLRQLTGGEAKAAPRRG